MLQAAAAVRNQTESSAEACECLRRRIVKLRWMGMDKEADALCRRLEIISPEECVPSDAPDTD